MAAAVLHLLAGVEASSTAAAIRRLNHHPEEALALLDLPQLQSANSPGSRGIRDKTRRAAVVPVAHRHRRCVVPFRPVHFAATMSRTGESSSSYFHNVLASAAAVRFMAAMPLN